MKPSLALEGRSGCKLEIIEINNQIVVRKFSSSQSYNQRLILQQEKQANFNTDELKAIGIKAPAIIRTGMDKELFYFDMPYVSGKKYSSYLIELSLQELDVLSNQFVRYFNLQFSNSSLQKIEIDIFNKKLAQIINICGSMPQIDNTLLILIEKSLSNPPKGLIPCGQCHGDFTLSNMLFTSRKEIITFDLLDSFINSPIIDWVKLRQDLKYNWTIHIEGNNKDSSTTKLKQTLNYLDQTLTSHFNKNAYIKEWEKYLTIFNFARILPYVKSKDDISYLTKNIKLLMNK